MPPPEPVQSAPIAPSADKTKSSGIDVFHIRHDFNKETYGKSWKLGDDLHLVVGDVVMATLPMQSAQQTSPKWMHGRIIGSLQSQVRWAFRMQARHPLFSVTCWHQLSVPHVCASRDGMANIRYIAGTIYIPDRIQPGINMSDVTMHARRTARISRPRPCRWHVASACFQSPRALRADYCRRRPAAMCGCTRHPPLAGN